MTWPLADDRVWRRSLRRDGFVVLHGLFGARAVRALVREVERVGRSPSAGGVSRRTLLERAGVFFGFAPHSPSVRRLYRAPRLSDVLAACIGEDVEFWFDKVVYRDSGVRYATPWHQDWAYWSGPHKYTLWIALSDVSRDSGCLRVIPGSHVAPVRHALRRHARSGFVYQAAPGRDALARAHDIPLSAGSAVLLHDLVLHSARPVGWGERRLAVVPAFRDASVDDYEYDFADASFMVRGRRTGKNLGPRPDVNRSRCARRDSLASP